MKPLFYKKPVLLNVKDHKEFTHSPVTDYSFTENSNSVYALVSEFLLLCKEYPVVFVKDKSDKYTPIVLLSTKKDDNSFIVKNGAWDAQYIPAYIRRYPFIFANNKADDSELMLAIDEEYKGFSNKKSGKKLFNKDGTHSKVISDALKFSSAFHSESIMTEKFCKTLDELDLFIESNFSSQKKGITLDGFFTINKEKFSNLDASTLEKLHKQGYVEAIVYHFVSLTSIDNLR